MRAILMILAVALLSVAAPVRAEDDTPARRAELASRLVRLAQGPGLTKAIDAQIESQLSQMEGMPEPQMEWMLTNAPPMLHRMVDRLLVETADLYAETFTPDELQAQIAMFETPIGRRIAAKSFDLGVRQGQVIATVNMEFLIDLQTKYCAEFDCPTDTAAKP